MKNFIFLCIMAGLISCNQKPFNQYVTIYFSNNCEQHKFAAQELKNAYSSHNIQVDFQELDDLDSSSKKSKVVIGVLSDKTLTEAMSAEKIHSIPDLKEQEYLLRTSISGYWVLGGDKNGAMYGALQLAENITLYGTGKTYSEEQSPFVKNRGIKFNIPFDKRSPTYYSSGFSENDFRGTSTKKAVEHVWNLSFWQYYFDELARNRFNAISLWSPHPFTSMVKLNDYPDAAIQNIEGFKGFSKNMSIDEKISFWQEVMKIAKNRGIDFYLYNWNIYTYGATGKYGIDNDGANQATVEYMRKSMVALLETYPDLKGFGVTAGENMGDIDDDTEAKWMWNSYGKGVYDYVSTHPEREFVFIHRYHGSGANEVANNFKALLELPNLRFDFSFKYAVAHIYSCPTPNFIRTRYGDVPSKIQNLGLKTWLELRNDDFYYLHWGNPDFVRSYLAGFPNKEELIQGFFMGSDGYTPTYVFSSKANWTEGKIEMDRLWYTSYLWGALAFNPNLPDKHFKQKLGAKYPELNQDTLFSAWKYASAGIPLMTELIQGTWKSDFLWYPEACMSRRYGFITINRMPDAEPTPGSKMCSIAETAAGNCGKKRSALDVADEIEQSAQKALELVQHCTQKTESEFETNIGNIRAMSYLSLYYAQKIRGAVYLASDRKSLAQSSMSKAVDYWLKYSNLMDRMYTGMDLQRNKSIPDWHFLDDAVKKEYNDL